MQDEPLTPAEREALAALPREQAPPVGLEDRTLRRLRRARMTRRPRRMPALLQAAAAVVIFAMGIATGRADFGPVREPSGNRYLLLLYGAPSPSAQDEQARIAEYGTWARETLASRLLAAEKLTDTSRVLGSPDAAPIESLQPAGFFLISAANRDEAEALASTCPHLRHGGTVVVREIEDTR